MSKNLAYNKKVELKKQNGEVTEWRYESTYETGVCEGNL